MPWSRHSIAFSCSSYVGKPCCRQRDLTGGRSGVLGPWGVGRIVALWRIFHGRWLKNHRKTDSNQLGLHFVKWFVSQSAFNSVSHSSLWVDQIKSNQYMRALWSMLTNFFTPQKTRKRLENCNVFTNIVGKHLGRLHLATPWYALPVSRQVGLIPRCIRKRWPSAIFCN